MPGRPPPRPAFPRETLIQYATALLVVVLVAAPLLPVLYQSLLDGALYDHEARLTLGNFSAPGAERELPRA